MPDLDQPAEKDERAPKLTLSNGVGRNASIDIQPPMIKETTNLSNGTQGPELDDFGLPIKKYRKPASGEDRADEDSAKGSSLEGAGKGSEGLSRPQSSCSDADEATGRSRDVKGSLQVLPEHSGSSTKEVAEGFISHSPQSSEAQSQLRADQRQHDSPIPLSNGHLNTRIVPEDVLLHENDSGHSPLAGASEWSHQQVVSQKHDGREDKREDDWQEMPAFAPYDIYDDNGKLVAREAEESDDEAAAYGGLGGAGKGYTRVQIDEDAQSATSMDDNTKYLFKETKTTALDEEDEEQRDPLAQMQATKDLLTEGQRIAYVGVTRLSMIEMVKELSDIEPTRGTKKELRFAVEAMTMWSQKMMVRLYMHMEINSAEQVMIEQLAEHGVKPGDLSPALMENSRVKNPMAEASPSKTDTSITNDEVTPQAETDADGQMASIAKISPQLEDCVTPPPPPYEGLEGEDLPVVRTPSQLPTTKNIDIDLRWTVLCDLFLVLISDSMYDSRSRYLLERVGACMDISWIDICRFEKRVTDALEMQEAANKENWNEDEHKENRRKMALKRRMVMMGLATVGGSLVIGLSAGLLAPVIGAGLAAGFTTIGVAGTGGFLAGAGGAAIITSGAAVSGGVIAVRASNRRTGAVKTFEYRPLHNNKRVNLIVTVSGWMNGKVDDVRLPFSTVDPIMGDIYSVLWEPEMLQSMGDTINILATEALTQGLQQVLGSTLLVALMASLQLPIVLTKLSYLIDNPWTVSLARAGSAGLILADSLIDRNLGVRPITFVGFSLGARVIFSCLQELANKGALGLVQNVYLFGSPIVAKKDEYLKAKSVVSGRFVNGYAKNDWILGYLFRATSGGIMRVAGLAPVEEVPGLENIEVTSLVDGHMAYRAAMPRLLREVGWSVESDEFTEIEDPDPENHQKRQRELIAELDEARKEVEEKPGKKGFNFFRRKKAEKKGWETYDESSSRQALSSETSAESKDCGGVLFDVEAIRAELASEQIEVKQLESTLPPMKISTTAGGTPKESPEAKAKQSPYSWLRGTKSFGATTAPPPKSEATSSLPSLTNGNRTNPYPDTQKDDGHHDHSVRDPDEVDSHQMMFEVPDHSSIPPQTSESPKVSPKRDSLQPQPVSNGFSPRPNLNSTNSIPVAMASLEHNAWADDDNPGLGKGKENAKFKLQHVSVQYQQSLAIDPNQKAMRKTDSSQAKTYLTAGNGPQISLLSTFRNRTANGKDHKDRTAVAIDAEPQTSSDESLDQSPPKDKPSPSPPRFSKRRKPVRVFVPKRGSYSRSFDSTEAQLDDNGVLHINKDNNDGGSVDLNPRRSSRHDGRPPDNCEKKKELREDKDEEDEFNWISSQPSKRRRYQSGSTYNIHGKGRPAVYGKGSKKSASVVGQVDSVDATTTNGFKDPRKYNLDLQPLESTSLAPTFKNPRKYARSQSPNSTDSNRDVPISSQGSDTPQFKMPPRLPEDLIGLSRNVDSPQFKKPTSLLCYEDDPIDAKTEYGTHSSMRMLAKEHKPASVTNVHKIANEVLPNGRSDFIHKILDDQAPTSSTASFSAPSTFDDMAIHSDRSSLSSPPASPILNSSQARELITIPDSSSGNGTTRCPLCKALVDEDLLDELRYGRRMGVQKQARFCRTHKKRSAAEEWKVRKYPDIDWDRLDARLKSYHHILEDILEGRRTSYYKDILKDSIASGRDRTMAQSMGGDGFHGLTPGYYGPRGARKMMDNIMRAFSPKLRKLATTDKAISSRGVSGFAQLVLVPELAVLLIKVDMHVKEERAREILEDSIEIGDLLCEEEDDEIKTSMFKHGVEG
ncbi:MAG: hypothetical protein M1812_003163 [Candelaria pacifica]|nr:MAG: hypothetical protein M1812_003163 [Candelaria pacifica]